MNNFRNIKGNSLETVYTKTPQLSNRQVFDVLKIRAKRAGDSGLWQDIYRNQVNKGYVVDDWIVWLVGILAGVGTGIAGFLIGKKVSDVGSIKKLVDSFIPTELKNMLPSKYRKILG